jgi:hypothetical protein
MGFKKGWKSQIIPIWGDSILQLKDPKNSTKTLLDLINTSNKLVGNQINIQKSVAFPMHQQWRDWKGNQ